MARFGTTDLSSDSFYGTLGLIPDVMRAWESVDDALMSPDRKLPLALKENARRALSRDVGCTYCGSFAEPPTDPADKRESLAIAFAEMVVDDYTSVNEGMFEALREEFDEEEILELCAWICYKFGGNVLGRLMQLDPSNDEQKAGYKKWMEERVDNPGGQLTGRASV